MEAVIKVGGSLAEEPTSIRALCCKLSELAVAHRILIVPGGGKFADTVREFDRVFNLSDSSAHNMAILAMDQYGLFLSDITPNSRTTTVLGMTKNSRGAGVTWIFLPSRLMVGRASVEHSWDVTSDSIAAYIAGELKAEKLILVTDVDGVFTADPKQDPNARLMETVTAGELLSSDRRTSVDRFLPKILLRTRLDCYVVNGRYPKRVDAILKGERVISTRIIV